jgi:bifunctional non-homologous end joining protein LigD
LSPQTFSETGSSENNFLSGSMLLPGFLPNLKPKYKTMSMQSKSLYYREGSSDKEYHVRIEPTDGKYLVNFAYGRRGTTLQTGTKTNTPVDLESATKIFSRIVSEKMAKGYTEGEAGTPYEHTENAGRVSGIQVQLLNPVTETEVGTFLQDDAFCAQEKYDGKRLLLKKEGAVITGINRRGLEVGILSSLISTIQLFPEVVFDGESIGEIFQVFDLLFCRGEDLRAKPYHERYLALLNVLSAVQQHQIKLVPTVWNTPGKTRLLAELRETNKEGIVFKQADASYTPGRPNSGGTQFKHKFYASASCIVAGTNKSKRSVRLVLFDPVMQKEAGNVTIPPNHEMPSMGNVVDVRYLYAFKESGSLYQPTYLGVRSDVSVTECTTAQLKYKAAEDEL